MENLEVKPQEATMVEMSQPLSKRKRKLCRLIILIILILLVVAGIVCGILYFLSHRVGLGEPGKWQAVFLVNNQVYFGKIVKETKSTLVLRDIYYLRETPNMTEKETGPQWTLVKLGEEIHGPTDEIRINKAMVLFVETLKPNSQVVQTIETLKTKK
jgi:flagellar basal body-associated protein FliL